MAPSRLGVASASGRTTGVATAMGVSGCPWRTTSMKAAVPARIISTLNGMRVQQFVPCVIEMTSASSAATCSAETISPRADPA